MVGIEGASKDKNVNNLFTVSFGKHCRMETNQNLERPELWVCQADPFGCLGRWRGVVGLDLGVKRRTRKIQVDNNRCSKNNLARRGLRGQKQKNKNINIQHTSWLWLGILHEKRFGTTAWASLPREEEDEEARVDEDDEVRLLCGRVRGCCWRALSLIHKPETPPTSLIESTMQEFAKRMCVTLLSWVTWLHMTDTAAGSFHGATPPPNNLPPHSCATPPTLAPRPHCFP